MLALGLALACGTDCALGQMAASEGPLASVLHSQTPLQHHSGGAHRLSPGSCLNMALASGAHKGTYWGAKTAQS